VALVDAKAALFNYKQSGNQSTPDYRDAFKELLSVLESYGGKLHDPINAVPTTLAKATGLSAADKDALMRNHYVAALFICNANGARYGALHVALSNSFVLRRDEYPMSLVDAYAMLLTQSQWPRLPRTWAKCRQERRSTIKLTEHITGDQPRRRSHGANQCTATDQRVGKPFQLCPT
jgi:hypothetical protein